MSRRDFARRFQEACGLEEADVARIRDMGLVASRLTQDNIARGFATFRERTAVERPVDRRRGEVGYGIVEN